MGKQYSEVNEYRMYTTKAELHKAVNSLMGLIRGIQYDGIITNEELAEVFHWCNLHRHLENNSPFNEIIPMIDSALDDGQLDEEEIQDIQWLCNRILHQDEFDEFYDLVTVSIQELEGILHGMLADRKLDDTEIDQLEEWMENHSFLLKGTYPFDEIDSLLTAVKHDGVVTKEEKSMLTAFFANFIDTKLSHNIHEPEIRSLQEKFSINGICAVCPEITFENKIFSFTGTSARATRNEIAEIINNKGGIFNNNVNKKTNYLIVGADGNPCWAYSCYGRKVEKAVQLRKAGSPIMIVHENDFWDETY